MMRIKAKSLVAGSPSVGHPQRNQTNADPEIVVLVTRTGRLRKGTGKKAAVTPRWMRATEPTGEEVGSLCLLEQSVEHA